MSKPKNEGPRHSIDRIARLERRMRQLVNKTSRSGSNIGEISALEWAIPILEKYVVDTYGYAPATRANYYKHEKTWIIDVLRKRDGDDCYLCGHKIAPIAMTVDHVVPLSKGGTDDTTNYKLTHSTCNLAKGNLSLEEYRALEQKAQEA
jgi:hypothetical protein